MEKVVLHTQRCKGCYLCIRECPKQADKKAGVSNKKGYEVIQVDESLCVACGTCYVVCPDYVFEIRRDDRT